MNHAKTDSGIPCRQKICQSSVRPCRQTFVLENIADSKRRLDHCFPRHTFAGIEIDNEPVRSFEILNGRVPWVELDCSDRDKAKKAIKTIDPKARAFPTFALS
jgi:hypothetical protein